MQEKIVKPASGAFMFLVFLALISGGIWSITQLALEALPAEIFWVPLVTNGLAVVVVSGLYTLQPNESRVLILFGTYKGTVKKSGWHWGNPFYSNGSPSSELKEERARNITTAKPVAGTKPDSRFKISLRARTEVGDTIKVNDRRGNPIEIAAVVVWRVSDTTKAVFEVDDYRTYVKTQIETALRHVATGFAYDNSESGELSGELTLRGNPEEVAHELRKDLEQRLAVAGVAIDDARLTHLAYAPEIAQAMLRRQQAEAVISARRKIVQGAVGMVELALADLEKSGSVTLDPERKAAMVSNLMVVLCSEREAAPVINAGTLYN
ncbi:MAG: SPFH domain-containing protein [Actinobacteria bacterium]|nr:SPFH domain-containing protein [Actinomycetota bacterium]